MSGHVERYITPKGKKRFRASIKSTTRTGERQRASKSFDNLSDAKTWLAEQIHFGSHGGTLGKGTLGKFLREWLSAREQSGNIRPNTISGYRSKIATAIRSIGHVRLSALAAEDIEAWLADLRQRRLSGSTISQSRAVMHKAIGDAVRRRYLPFNVVDAVETPSAPARPRPKVDSIEDAKRFLEAMDATNDGPLFRLMAQTGMRRSEVGGLTWGAVDLTLGRLDVRQTLIRQSASGRSFWIFCEPKSRSSRRTIPLPPQAVALLRTCQHQVNESRLAAGSAWTDNDLVFCTPYGEPLNLDALSARARRMRQKLGLPKGVQGVHGLRHLFGTTQHHVAGTDIKTLQTLMGHSRSTTTLDLYVAEDQEAAAEAARKAGELFG